MWHVTFYEFRSGVVLFAYLKEFSHGPVIFDCRILIAYPFLDVYPHIYHLTNLRYSLKTVY